jgi:hypothetical protein
MGGAKIQQKEATPSSLTKKSNKCVFEKWENKNYFTDYE